MLTNGILAYFIPEVPQKIKETLHHEKMKHQNQVFDEMHEKTNKMRKRNQMPNVRVRRPD